MATTWQIIDIAAEQAPHLNDWEVNTFHPERRRSTEQSLPHTVDEAGADCASHFPTMVQRQDLEDHTCKSTTTDQNLHVSPVAEVRNIPPVIRKLTLR
jgi:hypothetical protein